MKKVGLACIWCSILLLSFSSHELSVQKEGKLLLLILFFKAQNWPRKQIWKRGHIMTNGREKRTTQGICNAPFYLQISQYFFSFHPVKSQVYMHAPSRGVCLCHVHNEDGQFKASKFYLILCIFPFSYLYWIPFLNEFHSRVGGNIPFANGTLCWVLIFIFFNIVNHFFHDQQGWAQTTPSSKVTQRF